MNRKPHASELVAQAGQALLGEGWIRQLALQLQVNERTMRRLAAAAAAGEAYPVSRGMLLDLSKLLQDREGRMRAAQLAIDQHLVTTR